MWHIFKKIIVVNVRKIYFKGGKRVGHQFGKQIIGDDRWYVI